MPEAVWSSGARAAKPVLRDHVARERQVVGGILDHKELPSWSTLLEKVAEALESRRHCDVARAIGAQVRPWSLNRNMFRGRPLRLLSQLFASKCRCDGTNSHCHAGRKDRESLGAQFCVGE